MPRTHKILVDGQVTEIECTGGGDIRSEECPMCNQEKSKEVEEWIRSNAEICARCEEMPKCYLCLKHGCEDWGDRSFMEQYGTHRGCSKMLLGKYCSDFVCYWGLKGWWFKGWRKENAGTKRKIRRLVYRRHYEANKPRRKRKGSEAKTTRKIVTKVQE